MYQTIALQRHIASSIPMPNETARNKPKKLFKDLNLEDKMECYTKRPAFITLKDHKENFKSSQKSCLINPSKSEMGIVSNKYLENIISKLKLVSAFFEQIFIYHQMMVLKKL